MSGYDEHDDRSHRRIVIYLYRFPVPQEGCTYSDNNHIEGQCGPL